MGRRAYPGQGDPWADFLNARARVLEMWRRGGKSPAESARSMTMDPIQVTLILQTVAEHPEEFPQPQGRGEGRR